MPNHAGGVEIGRVNTELLVPTTYVLSVLVRMQRASIRSALLEFESVASSFIYTFARKHEAVLLVQVFLVGKTYHLQRRNRMLTQELAPTLPQL